MVLLSDSAKEELRKLLVSRSSGEGDGLRLAVARGGCAGMSYEMKVTSPEAGDEIVDFDGGRLIVAADSVDFLRGCEIDYSYELSDSGFKIENPNASRSCGCGTSFEPKDRPGDMEVSDPTKDGESCR